MIVRQKKNRVSSPRSRGGFTLVELLVVIAIIGVLVGLTVPAVMVVQKRFTNASIKFEVQALADAVEKYKSKHGDYPPDGSSWQQMETHLRKAFPNILQSELILLNPANNAMNMYIRNDYAGVGRVMDPAEALVFFLGGFSTDAQKPFTGKGGPFINTGTIAAPIYRYNPTRDNSFYEFKSGRLSVDETGISNDETVYGGAVDLLPVYASYGVKVPYVYFNSKTYQFPTTSGVCYNYHLATPTSDPFAFLNGVARPLLSSKPTAVNVYEAKTSFQIISPGRDGRYGWDASAVPVMFNTSGDGFAAPASFGGPLTSNGFQKFKLPIHAGYTPMLDNVASCIELTTFQEASNSSN